MYNQPVYSVCYPPATPVGRHLEPTDGNLKMSRLKCSGICGPFVSHVQRAVTTVQVQIVLRAEHQLKTGRLQQGPFYHFMCLQQMLTLNGSTVSINIQESDDLLYCGTAEQKVGKADRP